VAVDIPKIDKIFLSLVSNFENEEK